jgi:CMP-N-acetylneuraminic acid synthetase
MKQYEDVCYIVQARLGSERVPGKMVRPFAGTTLVDICLKKIKALDIKHDNFYFSAYEPELKEIADKNGLQIWHRSEESANSEGQPLTEIYDWYTLPYKYVVLISACNPLLHTRTIQRFINEYISSPYHSRFAVFEKKTYFWDDKKYCINRPGVIMNTKAVKPMYEAAHCLYAAPMDLIPLNQWMGDFTPNNPVIHTIPEQEAFDIDYEWQFKLGEKLYEME